MKSFFANVGLTIFSTVFALALVEIALHIVLPELPKADGVVFNRHHPLLGWEKTPGVSGRRVTEEYVNVEQINSKGLRGPDYPYKKEAGTTRVLVLGDSFVEAQQVSQGVMFTTLLEKELKKSKEKTEVVNGGTIGYSTDQELLFFRNEGIKYQPDVTVLMFFMNDVWFNNISKIVVPGEPAPTYKPVFRLNDGTLELQGVPVPQPASDGMPARAEPWKKRVKRTLRENSQVYHLISERIKSHPTLHSIAIRLGVARRPQFGELSVGKTVPVPDVYRVWQRSPLEAVKDAWRTTEAVLVAMRDEVEAAGSYFAIFYVPSIVEAEDQFWSDTLRKYGLNSNEWSRSRPHEVLEEICRRNNIPLIVSVEEFRNEAKRGNRLYFVTDRHWNEAGHRLVSKLVAQHLRQSAGGRIR